MKAGQKAAQRPPNSYNASMADTLGKMPLRYRFSDLTLDAGQRRLLRDTADIPLGKLTFDLLLVLVRSAPNVVTHDALVEQVWGGRMTSPETVTQRVKLLRDALGDDAENPRYIALVRNQGYRLIPLDKDPGDALAYAGLALGYATYGHGPSPKPDVWPRARAAALRAVQLDPDLAEAHAALADVMLYMQHDWKAAEQGFLRAKELSPSLATNHFHYAWYLALFGRWEEALAEHKRAQELDPFTPSHTHWLGGMYLYNSLGRHVEANTEALRALELQPDNPSALLVLGMAQSAAGRHEQAIATHLKMVQLDPSLKWELGVSYVAADRNEDASAILDELQREPPNSWNAYGQAVLNARLGNLDKAFEWLGYDPPHAWVPWVRVDPWLRPYIEQDPRFPALLKRMQLPL
jgi:tetratricopeptide (TPR) repeat protein